LLIASLTDTDDPTAGLSDAVQIERIRRMAGAVLVGRLAWLCMLETRRTALMQNGNKAIVRDGLLRRRGVAKLFDYSDVTIGFRVQRVEPRW